MQKRQLFMWLAAASGYIGIGMVLAYTMTDRVKNAPMWIGGLLILLGAVVLGMFISSRNDKHAADADNTTEGTIDQSVRNR